jgi:hypothetical protein
MRAFTILLIGFAFTASALASSNLSPVPSEVHALKTKEDVMRTLYSDAKLHLEVLKEAELCYHKTHHRYSTDLQELLDFFEHQFKSCYSSGVNHLAFPPRAESFYLYGFSGKCLKKLRIKSQHINSAQALKNKNSYIGFRGGDSQVAKKLAQALLAPPSSECKDPKNGFQIFAAASLGGHGKDFWAIDEQSELIHPQ